MSKESIEGIYVRFANGVEQACREGRGKAHLHDYFGAIAVDFASTVFLAITFSTKDLCLENLETLIEQHGTGLIDGVRETMTAFCISDLEAVEAEMVTAAAYQECLNKLFGSTVAGGSA